MVKPKLSTSYKSYRLLLAGLCVFHSPAVLTADNELFFDMPMVLSASRLEQPIADAAVSISVIDRETIEASGARTIPEVLRLVPGMQVGFSGNEFGDRPRYVVAYHGHSDQYSRQMQVLIDGRSIYEPFFGGINWKAIPVNINDIERIEVSRGPNLATYGANSFQAAINIITRTAAEDQGSFIHSNLGSNNIADLTYRYAGSSGKLDYRFTLATFNDAGLNSANQFDYPDDTHSNNIDYRFDYQIDNKNTLSYQGGYGQNQQQADKNYSGILPVKRTVDSTRFFQFLKWEKAINQKNSLLLQYYYNLSDEQDKFESDILDLGTPPIDPFRLNVNASIKSERHNLELTQFIQPDENLKLTWGLSAQADFVRSALYLGTDRTICHEQYRAFANIEWQFSRKNTLNTGALVEKNGFTDTELSPRLSISHTFNRHHKVRVGISQAIRSPFIFEAMANFSFSHNLTASGIATGITLRDNIEKGNPNLKNEKIISREIVYLGEFINSSLLFNARLFHDDITNYIRLVRQTDASPDTAIQLIDDSIHFFENPAYSTTTGLELELDYHIDPTLRLIASGAIINIDSNLSAIPKSAPQHSFSFITNKHFNENYSGSLAYYYVESFKWKDVRGGVDSHQTLDIKLSRKIKLHQARGSVSVVLKNLLGDYSDYQENPSRSAAPQVVHSTLAYLDLKLNF